MLTLLKLKLIRQLAIESIKSKKKVFCIGLNKTGTSSLNHFMEKNGFKCSNQAQGELLIDDYAQSNWEPILNFCETAQFFQDLPFSAPRIAQILLKEYPEAKFILTLRESPEVWYESLVSFHKKVFSAEGETPTAAELKAATYRYPGFAWEANRALYDSPENDPYNAEILKKMYVDHMENVQRMFANRTNLLTLYIHAPDIVSQLESFLGIESKLKEMPWLNKTADYLK
jgi:hypothetical protein